MALKIGKRNKDLARRYLSAKKLLMESGFDKEIKWQQDIDIANVTEQNFIGEAAWVILSSGMRESVIRKIYPQITKSFNNWESATDIVLNKKKYLSNSKKIFNHHKKLNAIITIAKGIKKLGYTRFKKFILDEGVDYLMSFPYLGQATAFHLAKNIGLDEVKPDRHLMRVASITGFDNPKLLCQSISDIVGDKISVVDLVIWRFATISPDYKTYFTLS